MDIKIFHEGKLDLFKCRGITYFFKSKKKKEHCILINNAPRLAFASHHFMDSSHIYQNTETSASRYLNYNFNAKLHV